MGVFFILMDCYFNEREKYFNSEHFLWVYTFSSKYLDRTHIERSRNETFRKSSPLANYINRIFIRWKYLSISFLLHVCETLNSKQNCILLRLYDMLKRQREKIQTLCALAFFTYSSRLKHLSSLSKTQLHIYRCTLIHSFHVIQSCIFVIQLRNIHWLYLLISNGVKFYFSFSIRNMHYFHEQVNKQPCDIYLYLNMTVSKNVASVSNFLNIDMHF